MSKEDKNILGAFLLVRHIEELTIEEIKDVQQAIKRVWNNFDKAAKYINIFKNDIRGLDDIVLTKILEGKDNE